MPRNIPALAAEPRPPRRAQPAAVQEARDEQAVEMLRPQAELFWVLFQGLNPWFKGLNVLCAEPAFNSSPATALNQTHSFILMYQGKSELLGETWIKGAFM